MRRKLEQTKSDRRFQLWEYLVSHGQLLLRSQISCAVEKRPAETTNVDLIFSDVHYVSLPHDLNGFELEAATPSEDALIREIVGPTLHENCKVHVLVSEGKRFYVVGIFGGLWENDWKPFESPLDFHHVNRGVDAARPIISVRVDVRAPAEWVYEHGTGPFDGVLVDSDSHCVLLKLLRPIRYRMSYHRTVLASLADSDSPFKVEFGKQADCKLFPMRDMEMFSVDPSELMEEAKTWAAFDKEGLTGRLQILNYNSRFWDRQ